MTRRLFRATSRRLAFPRRQQQQQQPTKKNGGFGTRFMSRMRGGGDN